MSQPAHLLLASAVVALLTWRTCNTFIPIIAAELAQVAAKAQNEPDRRAMQLIEQWKTATTYSFTAGGLIDTLLTMPVAKFLGENKY